MYDKDNIFAKIIRGEIPSKKVYENAYALSFWDVNPVADTHVLVVPRGEYTDILDFSMNASDDEKLGFFDCLNQTAEKLGIDECNMFVNTGNGPYMVQSVPHFHMHIISGNKIKEFSDFAK
ncbi:MAG: HIT domain-containing protein [Alphaproteobacteria bacterium]|mgnify:CR=1 FL=1|nr:HIT domain-containing protein [Alphaproteobacteria bacterium]